MERSSQDSSVRTVRPVPPKNLKKFISPEPNFLMWFQGHQPAMPLDEGKKLYVEEVNIRRKAKYAKHLEEYQRYLDIPRNEDQFPNLSSPDQSPSPSRLTTLKKNTIMTTPLSQSIPFQSSSSSEQPSPDQSFSEQFTPEQPSPEHSFSEQFTPEQSTFH